jgi:hypothetical protein
MISSSSSLNDGVRGSARRPLMDGVCRRVSAYVSVICPVVCKGVFIGVTRAKQMVKQFIFFFLTFLFYRRSAVIYRYLRTLVSTLFSAHVSVYIPLPALLFFFLHRAPPLAMLTYSTAVAPSVCLCLPYVHYI